MSDEALELLRKLLVGSIMKPWASVSWRAITEVREHQAAVIRWVGNYPLLELTASGRVTALKYVRGDADE